MITNLPVWGCSALFPHCCWHSMRCSPTGYPVWPSACDWSAMGSFESQGWGSQKCWPPTGPTGRQRWWWQADWTVPRRRGQERGLGLRFHCIEHLPWGSLVGLGHRGDEKLYSPCQLKGYGWTYNPQNNSHRLTLDIECDRGIIALSCPGVGCDTHQLPVPLPGPQREGAVVIGPWSHDLWIFLWRHHQTVEIWWWLSLLLPIQVPGEQKRGMGIPAIWLAVEPVCHVLLKCNSCLVPSINFRGSLNCTCVRQLCN